MVKVLLVFTHQLLPFRLEEVDSICSLFNIAIRYDREAFLAVNEETPFLWADFDALDDARLVVERSLTVKVALDVWGQCQGDAYEVLLAMVAEGRKEELSERHLESFKFEVHRFGASITMPEKLERINRFSAVMANHGKVELTVPQRVYWLIEDWGLPNPKLGKGQKPLAVYFGRQLGTSAKNSAAVDRYSLQKRKYLGTTSMRPDLSFLAANQAKARKGSLVMDPFVGTGSLMIGCAHFGALAVGSDIDARVLRGTMKSPHVPPGANLDNANVFDNFRQYGMAQQLCGLVIQDSAHSAWRAAPLLDAIVCDPPYGVRAGAKTIRPASMPSKRQLARAAANVATNVVSSSPGSSSPSSSPPSAKKQRPHDGTDHLLDDESPIPLIDSTSLEQQPAEGQVEGPVGKWRVPRFIEYGFGAVLVDLLNFALERLVMGGRLVFWIPTNHHFHAGELPVHPSLRFVGASMEKLTRACARVLVTMEKTAPFDRAVDAAVPPIPLERLATLSFANFGYEYFGEDSTRQKLIVPQSPTCSSSV